MLFTHILYIQKYFFIEKLEHVKNKQSLHKCNQFLLTNEKYLFAFHCEVTVSTYVFS